MEKASFPEQWLQVFAKFSLDFFVVELGPHNKVLYRSERSPTCFGYPAEVFVAQIEKSFAELALKTDRPRIAKAMQGAQENKADIDLQFYLVRADGSPSLVHLAGTYLYSHQEVPTYMFLFSDEQRSIGPLDREFECFRICFFVDTGSLVEVNLQGRTAFLTQEFISMYDAITAFGARYVHPQDRKAFAAFTNHTSLETTIHPKGVRKEIPFRRTSHNTRFSGFKWSMLSYSFEKGDDGADLVCDLLIEDSDKSASILAEKTLQTQLDPLTGVLNRSALESQVTQQLALCSAQTSKGAFYMLDID